RLFIAREAVDTHMRVAGALIDPKVPAGQKVTALLKAGAFYAFWYPKLWLGVRGWFGFGEFGRLAPHMRYVERSSRRLSPSLFFLMVCFGSILGQRQAYLGR